MSEQRIRVVALCVVRRDDDLLVVEAETSDVGTYYRPPSANVRFGEHAVDALRREFREWLEVELETLREVATFQSVFERDGRRRHEVQFVYEAEFVQQWPYRMDEFTAYEPDLDEELDCLWKPVSDFTEVGATLVPERLARRL
jgi:ADP-ribose pyrophosphatase YjhB (NUDIX family)